MFKLKKIFFEKTILTCAMKRCMFYFSGFQMSNIIVSTVCLSYCLPFSRLLSILRALLIIISLSHYFLCYFFLIFVYAKKIMKFKYKVQMLMNSLRQVLSNFDDSMDCSYFLFTRLRKTERRPDGQVRRYFFFVTTSIFWSFLE